MIQNKAESKSLSLLGVCVWGGVVLGMRSYEVKLRNIYYILDE